MPSALPSPDAVMRQLDALGRTVPPGRLRVGAYGDSPELSAELLALIRAGRKRAGTSLLWAFEAEGEPLPAAGDIELVVDPRGRAALVTRITRVDVLPFDEVGAEYAAIEGEGDGSLRAWREGHWAFFSRECERLARVPSPRMPVVCAVFEVLDVVQDVPPPTPGRPA